MIFVLAIAMILSGALPRADEASAVRRALENRYKQAHTFQAIFYQKYSDSRGGGTAESGTVYFSRPDRMRWEYESPQQKLFLVDGANAWFYVPADRTVSRAKIKQSSDWRTPIALLAGTMDLGKLCREVQLVRPGDSVSNQPLNAEDAVLRCTPRNSPQGSGDDFKEVLLEVDPQGYLMRVVIRQAGDLEMEFRFASWKENIALPEVDFHFVPPPGVSVVDEQSLMNGPG
jgi:outer membrane lipoprotein carrier protein